MSMDAILKRQEPSDDTCVKSQNCMAACLKSLLTQCTRSKVVNENSRANLRALSLDSRSLHCWHHLYFVLGARFPSLELVAAASFSLHTRFGSPFAA